MSNYERFSAYQAPVNEVAPTLRPRIDPDAGMTSSVVIRNGVSIAQTSSAGRATTEELNPGHNSGTIFETARSITGAGVSEIKGDTLLTIDGVQAPASFWEKEGVIHRGGNGIYAEGQGEAKAGTEGAPAETSQASTDDDLAMPPEITAAIDQALDGVQDQGIAPLIASGISVVLGDLDHSRVVQQMAQASGSTPEQAEAKVALMQAAFQQQADAALTARCGIDTADLADFYEFAKLHHPGDLRGALEKQVHAQDLSGYRALAARYLNDNPPSLDAVKAGGYETRSQGQVTEVKLGGQWMSIATAARLGML